MCQNLRATDKGERRITNSDSKGMRFGDQARCGWQESVRTTNAGVTLRDSCRDGGATEERGFSNRRIEDTRAQPRERPLLWDLPKLKINT